MFSHKGQSSFEVIMIVVVVLSVSTVIISNYIKVGETSVAMGFAKQSIVEKLMRLPKPYSINNLEGFGCGTALHLRVNTFPNDLDGVEFNSVAPSSSQVETDVVNNTIYQSINLKINEAIEPCP